MLCFRTCESARIFVRHEIASLRANSFLHNTARRGTPPQIFPTPPCHKMVRRFCSAFLIRQVRICRGRRRRLGSLHAAAAGDHLLGTAQPSGRLGPLLSEGVRIYTMGMDMDTRAVGSLPSLARGRALLRLSGLASWRVCVFTNKEKGFPLPAKLMSLVKPARGQPSIAVVAPYHRSSLPLPRVPQTSCSRASQALSMGARDAR